MNIYTISNDKKTITLFNSRISFDDEIEAIFAISGS